MRPQLLLTTKIGFSCVKCNAYVMLMFLSPSPFEGGVFVTETITSSEPVTAVCTCNVNKTVLETFCYIRVLNAAPWWITRASKS